VPTKFATKDGTPAPNFSPGILVDGTLYVAGQVGTGPHLPPPTYIMGRDECP
jgi:enamine deaminase RidA (YjgF/YER057c/UK114 family)